MKQLDKQVLDKKDSAFLVDDDQRTHDDMTCFSREVVGFGASSASEKRSHHVDLRRQQRMGGAS